MNFQKFPYYPSLQRFGPCWIILATQVELTNYKSLHRVNERSRFFWATYDIILNLIQ